MRGSHRTALVLVVALGAASLGCRTTKVSLAEGPREYVPAQYPVVLDRWTRETEASIRDLDPSLKVTATFLSWDFEWSYVVRYADDYRLTVEQRRELLDHATRQTHEWHEFYVAIYGTHNRRWADIASAKTSAWIVRLIDDLGDETAPVAIDPIPRPGAIETTYFPYTNAFRQVFRIRFPRETVDHRQTIAPQAKWFGLKFAGAEGNQELQWELEAPLAQQRAQN